MMMMMTTTTTTTTTTMMMMMMMMIMIQSVTLNKASRHHFGQSRKQTRAFTFPGSRHDSILLMIYPVEPNSLSFVFHTKQMLPLHKEFSAQNCLGQETYGY